MLVLSPNQTTTSNENSGSTVHKLQKIILKEGRKLVIGRNDCDLCLESRSVSRVHATIEVLKSDDGKINVFLTNHSSRLGTHVKHPNSAQEIRIGDRIKLNVGDKIYFGTRRIAFFLEEIKISLCFSGVSTQDKRVICEISKNLGVEFCSSWTNSCTHLIMSSMKITMKAVLALACCKHLVTPEWIKIISNEMKVYQESEFIPELNSSVSLSRELFLQNLARKHIFENINFIFKSDLKNSKILKDILEASGGSVYVLKFNQDPIEIVKNIICNQGKCALLIREEDYKDDPILKSLTQTGISHFSSEEIAKFILLAETPIVSTKITLENSDYSMIKANSRTLTPEGSKKRPLQIENLQKIENLKKTYSFGVKKQRSMEIVEVLYMPLVLNKDVGIK